jgi:hypothetical protein
MTWSSILGGHVTTSVEQRVRKARREHWLCVGQCEWSQQSRQCWIRGARSTFVHHPLPCGDSFGLIWRHAMRSVEPHDASAATPKYFSPISNNTFFSKACYCRSITMIISSTTAATIRCSSFEGC